MKLLEGKIRKRYFIQESITSMTSSTQSVGRPLLFKSPKELQEKIDEYFADCDNTIIKTILDKNKNIIATVTKPYTVTGMAYFLNTCRETLVDYGEKEEFSDTIKRAKMKIQTDYEERALTMTSHPIFSMFTLANNFGWKNKSEQDITTNGEKIGGFNFILPGVDDKKPEDNSGEADLSKDNIIKPE